MIAVQYSGTFAFMRPVQALRDSLTYSNRFITPSTLEGIRQKLGVSKIVRARLDFQDVQLCQEATHTVGINTAFFGKRALRSTLMKHTNQGRAKSVINRGVLINPLCTLLFDNEDDALKAFEQSICLSRNEDILLPDAMFEVEDFDKEISGYEFIETGNNYDQYVGVNRFTLQKSFGRIIYNGISGKEQSSDSSA